MMKSSAFIILLMIIYSGCGKIKDPYGLEKWEVISDVDEDLNALYFIDENMGWAVGSGGKIFSTKDGGIKWVEQNSNCTSKLRSVLFIDENTGFVSGNDQTLLITIDGGQNWGKILVECDSGTVFNGLHYDKNGTIGFISNYGDIFNSTDLGLNWICTDQLKSWGFSYLYFTNNCSGIAASGSGKSAFKRSDGCEVWKAISLPVQWVGDIYFIDENNGWISENWGPSSIIQETVSIYFTNDMGGTWTKLSELPGMDINNIVFVDNNIGWISEITEIYHTNDGGKSWIIQFDSEDYNIGYIRDIFFVNYTDGWGLSSKGKIIRYFE